MSLGVKKELFKNHILADLSVDLLSNDLGKIDGTMTLIEDSNQFQLKNPYLATTHPSLSGHLLSRRISSTHSSFSTSPSLADADLNRIINQLLAQELKGVPGNPLEVVQRHFSHGAKWGVLTLLLENAIRPRHIISVVNNATSATQASNSFELAYRQYQAGVPVSDIARSFKTPGKGFQDSRDRARLGEMAESRERMRVYGNTNGDSNRYTTGREISTKDGTKQQVDGVYREGEKVYYSEVKYATDFTFKEGKDQKRDRCLNQIKRLGEVAKFSGASITYVIETAIYHQGTETAIGEIKSALEKTGVPFEIRIHAPNDVPPIRSKDFKPYQVKDTKWKVASKVESIEKYPPIPEEFLPRRTTTTGAMVETTDPEFRFRWRENTPEVLRNLVDGDIGGIAGDYSNLDTFIADGGLELNSLKKGLDNLEVKAQELADQLPDGELKRTAEALMSEAKELRTQIGNAETTHRIVDLLTRFHEHAGICDRYQKQQARYKDLRKLIDDQVKVIEGNLDQTLAFINEVDGETKTRDPFQVMDEVNAKFDDIARVDPDSVILEALDAEVKAQYGLTDPVSLGDLVDELKRDPATRDGLGESLRRFDEVAKRGLQTEMNLRRVRNDYDSIKILEDKKIRGKVSSIKTKLRSFEVFVQNIKYSEVTKLVGQVLQEKYDIANRTPELVNRIVDSILLAYFQEVVSVLRQNQGIHYHMIRGMIISESTQADLKGEEVKRITDWDENLARARKMTDEGAGLFFEDQPIYRERHINAYMDTIHAMDNSEILTKLKKLKGVFKAIDNKNTKGRSKLRAENTFLNRMGEIEKLVDKHYPSYSRDRRCSMVMHLAFQVMINYNLSSEAKTQLNKKLSDVFEKKYNYSHQGYHGLKTVKGMAARASADRTLLGDHYRDTPKFLPDFLDPNKSHGGTAGTIAIGYLFQIADHRFQFSKKLRDTRTQVGQRARTIVERYVPQGALRMIEAQYQTDAHQIRQARSEIIAELKDQVPGLSDADATLLVDHLTNPPENGLKVTVKINGEVHRNLNEAQANQMITKANARGEKVVLEGLHGRLQSIVARYPNAIAMCEQVSRTVIAKNPILVTHPVGNFVYSTALAILYLKVEGQDVKAHGLQVALDGVAMTCGSIATQKGIERCFERLERRMFQKYPPEIARVKIAKFANPQIRNMLINHLPGIVAIAILQVAHAGHLNAITLTQIGGGIAFSHAVGTIVLKMLSKISGIFASTGMGLILRGIIDTLLVPVAQKTSDYLIEKWDESDSIYQMDKFIVAFRSGVKDPRYQKIFASMEDRFEGHKITQHPIRKRIASWNEKLKGIRYHLQSHNPNRVKERYRKINQHAVINDGGYLTANDNQERYIAEANDQDNQDFLKVMSGGIFSSSEIEDLYRELEELHREDPVLAIRLRQEVKNIQLELEIRAQGIAHQIPEMLVQLQIKTAVADNKIITDEEIRSELSMKMDCLSINEIKSKLICAIWDITTDDPDYKKLIALSWDELKRSGITARAVNTRNIMEMSLTDQIMIFHVLKNWPLGQSPEEIEEEIRDTQPRLFANLDLDQIFEASLDQFEG